MPTTPRSLLLVLVLAGACSAANAQTAPPQWWGNFNIGSMHFESERAHLPEGERFREFNPGIGVEVQWQPRHAVAAGYFLNSVDEDSLYALYHYTPLQLGRFVRVGGMLGAVTGYPGYNNGGIAPAAGLIGKIEGQRVGANLIYVPQISGSIPHTLGLQFKLRFGP